ncbi:MAG: heavy metal-associated domain-containing protein [Myroides sp.]
MKEFIKILGLAAIVLTVSCKDDVKKQTTESNAVKQLAQAPILTENLKTVNLKIDGMSCALSCAKMIEGKLAKAKGVDSVKVDFETKLAYVSFDKTQQSKEELITTIDALLDGKTYKASEAENK